MLKAVYADAVAQGNLLVDLLNNSCLDSLAMLGDHLE